MGSHRDYSICHSFLTVIVVVLLIDLDSQTVEMCHHGELCLASPESGIVVGVIDSSGTKCTEFGNNSLIVLNESNISITTTCGIRCTGRQRLDDRQVLEWLIPPSSQLITTSLGGMQNTCCINRPYLDLIRSRSFNVGTDEGIYTCSVGHGSRTLHIGLYRAYPGISKHA